MQSRVAGGPPPRPWICSFNCKVTDLQLGLGRRMRGSIITDKLLTLSVHRRPGVVLRQEESRAHCTSLSSENMPVPNSSQGAVDMEVSVFPEQPTNWSVGYCYTCMWTVWTSSHLWREQRPNGEPASSAARLWDCVWIPLTHNYWGMFLIHLTEAGQKAISLNWLNVSQRGRERVHILMRTGLGGG